MSATIWLETESGCDTRLSTRRHNGYSSGNRGEAPRATPATAVDDPVRQARQVGPPSLEPLSRPAELRA